MCVASYRINRVQKKKREQNKFLVSASVAKATLYSCKSCIHNAAKDLHLKQQQQQKISAYVFEISKHFQFVYIVKIHQFLNMFKAFSSNIQIQNDSLFTVKGLGMPIALWGVVAMAAAAEVEIKQQDMRKLI